jgi:hypothetical protein
MNQRQFASVLFAVTGIYIAVSRIPEFAIHAAFFYQFGSGGDVAGGETLLTGAALTATIVTAGIGVALILLRDRLARRLFPTDTAPLEVRGLQTAAFSVIGVYFAVQGISRLPWSGQVGWSAIVQVVLGVALFLGARGLSRLWLQIQQRADAAQRAT